MRTRIKFCGITDAADLRDAVRLGADAVGFVFYRPSPRWIQPGAARELRRLLPSWTRAVGLLVDAPPEQVRETSRRVGLDVIQFHGDESPEQCRISIGAKVAANREPGGEPDDPHAALRWWRAVRMRSPVVLLESFDRFKAAEALLLDSFSQGYGGSGTGFDWSWIPPVRSLPIGLSGGLSPDNVAAAIARIRPEAVDVSSGIQSPDPRRKSVARMERFVAEVLRADTEVYRTSIDASL